MHEGDQAAIENRCANCRQPLRPGARYCSYCGHAPAAGSDASPPLSQPAVASAPRSREIVRVAGLFGLLLATSLASIIARRHFSTPWLLGMFSCFEAVVVLVFVGIRRHEIAPLLRLPTVTPRGVFYYVALALVFFGLLSGYFLAIERAGIPLVRISADLVEARWPLWAMLVLFSAMPAIFEELAFRGVIQSSLEHVFDAREAWIVQAALFGVLHILPVSFVSHFFMGLCFGYLRRRSGSLYPGMILHASWNAFALWGELYWR